MTVKAKCVDCPPGAAPRQVASGKAKPRCAEHTRARRKTVSLDAWEKNTLSRYKMTAEEYWALYDAQGGRCYLCQWATGKTKRLAVDHDHECCPGRDTCGKCVRGLLCGPCNQLLGPVKEKMLAFFQRCIDYLTNPPANRFNWRKK